MALQASIAEEPPSANDNVVLGASPKSELDSGEHFTPAPTQKPKPAANINLKDVVGEGQLESQDRAAQTAEDAAVESRVSSQSLSELEPEPKKGILKKITENLIPNEIVAQPLVILGKEVSPGTSTRLGWSPGASFIGISAPTAVLVLHGAKPGPKLCLTAAVHGDELNGVEIVRRLMYDIDPMKLNGSVIGVPIVNLQGFRRGTRYLPDRRDLNRFFPGNPEGSSASRIAFSFFSEVVSHCDMLLDLHTGSFRRTNLPQLRADLTHAKVDNLAKKMGAIVVVQSEGAEGSLRRAAVQAGIPAVTLEAGAPHELSKADIDHGVKSIESAMDNLGMIHRRRFWERAAEPIYYESSWVRAKEGGMLFSDVSLGAEVQEGDLLGTVTDPITNKHSEILAPFAGQIIGMALNRVMFPGFAAYHIGHKPEVEELIPGAPVFEEVQPGFKEPPIVLEQDSEGGVELTPIEDSE